MACIVKIPQNMSKGVLVVTDGEYRDWLVANPAMRARFERLRGRWLIAVHANSAIQQSYTPDSLVDVFIAGPGDIASAGSTPLPQIAMDCSNFSPDFFAPAPNESKFWDILFVSRNQPFKSLDKLFDIVRVLFDQEPLRVLALIAHTNLEDLASSQPLKLYQEKFTARERKLFTLLTPWVDYPFSLDLPTLAQLYHKSRLFLHTAAEERHPRVVGYAWAAGLPVVARSSAAALLPPELAQPPGFFAFETVEEAARQVRRALAIDPLPASYSQFHLTSFQIERFKKEIRDLYARHGESFVDGGWQLDDLDIRLARHHDVRAGSNSYRASLNQFASLLEKPLPGIAGPGIEEALDMMAFAEADDPTVQPRADNGGLRQVVRNVLGRLG
jgi:hypothetical protein